jgi:capsular exopolysaccharide synthesis family protein
LITAVDFPGQESERNREARRELPSPCTLLPPSEEWLRSVRSIEARVVPEARLVMFNDPYSVGADRFRVLRMHLRALGKSGKLRVLMVTSALPNEGKTVTALNLAVGLSERAGCSVALVEADLRHPVLADRLGLEKVSGLVPSLQDGLDPLSALCRVSPFGIYLLPAGETSANPIELLNSEGFARAIQRLRSAVEWVIIDAPPVVPVPDVLAIRNNVDACLWVMRAHNTSREMVRDAMDLVGSDLIVGMLLNEADDLEKSYRKTLSSSLLQRAQFAVARRRALSTKPPGG